MSEEYLICKSKQERIEAIDTMRSLGIYWHGDSSFVGSKVESHWPFVRWPTICLTKDSYSPLHPPISISGYAVDAPQITEHPERYVTLDVWINRYTKVAKVDDNVLTLPL